MKSLLQKETPDAPEMALRIFLCILIIIVGIGIFLFFNKTKPKVKKVRPERQPPLVEIIKASAESRQIVVSALGTVTTEKEVELKSQVSGVIVMVSPEFIPGGLFKKGAVILKIDPADYLLDIKRKENLLSSAQATFNIEMGYQDVAREEFSLMEVTTGKKINDSELALRKPQLDQAKAQLETAKVNLEAARLNHKRTVIKAPFNGMVKSRSVNTGSQVSAQLSLGTLTGTDAYWVEALVPVTQLDSINIPVSQNEQGSSVIVATRYQSDYSGVKHKGEVIRLTGSLSGQSRMATVLIRVPDPLILKKSFEKFPLILGSYVSLEIEGKTTHNVISLPRKALRDNDTVWILKDKRLSIQSIEAVWRGENFLYVKSGIEDGDSIIISKLSSPIEGMQLTEQGSAFATDKMKNKAKKEKKI